MELKIVGAILQKCILKPGEHEVIVPHGVRIIDWAAFASCAGLRRVVLPEGLLEIRRGAFQNCRMLMAVKLPERLKAVHENAFAGCSALCSIVLPDSLTALGARAFEGCVALEQMKLPPRLKRIDSMTFRNCKKLQKVYLNDALDEIGLGAFESCTALRQIRFPEKMIAIEERAFRMCSALRQPKLPQRLEVMGDRCFEGCTSLVTLILPEGIMRLPSFLCKDCTALEQAALPASLSREVSCYAESPFDNCPRLKRMIVRGELFEQLRSALRELCDQLTQLYVSSPKAFKDAECFNFYRYGGKLLLLSLRTYAADQSRFSPETQNEYHKFIRQYFYKIFGNVIDHADLMGLICSEGLIEYEPRFLPYYINAAFENPAQLSRLLRYMCGRKWFTHEETLKLIDRTTQIDQSEATAVLLQYQNEHFPVPRSDEDDDSLFLPDWDEL